MRFRFEHVIEGPLATVEGALLHPRLLARLPRYAPLIRSAELVSRRELDGVIERVARYRAAALPVLLRRLAPAGAGQWVEWTRWSHHAHAGSFRIEPSLGPSLLKRFACEGTYRLEPIGPSTTRRIVEGRLRIDAPALGAAIERTVIALMARQFAGEAALLGALAGAP